MKTPTAEQYLHHLLNNGGKWVHVKKRKRKNSLHDKSDSEVRQKLFFEIQTALQLMGIEYRTVRGEYFIQVKATTS